jgi:hypothetical protein
MPDGIFQGPQSFFSAVTPSGAPREGFNPSTPTAVLFLLQFGVEDIGLHGDDCSCLVSRMLIHILRDNTVGRSVNRNESALGRRQTIRMYQPEESQSSGGIATTGT